MGATRRQQKSPDVVELTVPSDARFLEVIHACIEQVCLQTECLSDEEIYKIAWGVHEACVNVIEHAHQFQASLPLCLQVQLYSNRIEFFIFDEGPGFDLEQVPEPDPAQIFERGRGLFGIRHCMDVVEYRQESHRNYLRLVHLLGSLTPHGENA